MLCGWKHSGFNIHRSQRVPPRNREDMERLAQYIIRNPFSVDKMQPNSSGHSIIYRSGMNPKIQRSFEVFSPCDFIARITQHIPDKSFHLVRYYGWYSNKMRGQRLKQTDAGPATRPNPSSWSLNPDSMTHSPTTTTNRCLRKTGNLRSGKLRTGGSYFPLAHPPNPAFRGAGYAAHLEMMGD